MVSSKQETPAQPILIELGVPTIPNILPTLADELKPMEDIGMDQLHGMLRNDGQVAGLFRMLTVPIKSSRWQITKPRKARSNSANNEYNFIQEIFSVKNDAKGMRTPLPNVLSTIIRMLLDGWSPHEIVWVVTNGEVRVDKIAYRSPSTVKVKVNKHGEITGYRQSKSPLNLPTGDPDNIGEVEIPRQKVLHFVNGFEWNPIFGRSLFTQAYYHHQKKT